MMTRSVLYFFTPLLFCACTASTPRHINNACELLQEKTEWYEQLKNTHDKWGVPIYVTLAIMRQESAFVADAQPPRPRILGFIPWFRDSSAYGYAQAQDGTWEEYLKHEQSHWFADRDDFADASDFIGWYCAISHHKLGISKQDTLKLYLAYHEGYGGFRKKTYLKKPWLMNVARKVANKSRSYRAQLSRCQNDLESKLGFFW